MKNETSQCCKIVRSIRKNVCDFDIGRYSEEKIMLNVMNVDMDKATEHVILLNIFMDIFKV